MAKNQKLINVKTLGIYGQSYGKADKEDMITNQRLRKEVEKINSFSTLGFHISI